MSRVTAPVAKLTRALSSAPAVARSSNPLLDSTTHNAGPALMPKYAELLRGRHDHSDSSRGLSTTHRPTPQPSISNRNKPLMQTFSSSAAPSAASTNIDATLLPSMDFETVSFSRAPRVPILPDNYSVGHGPDAAESQHVPMPSIVAVDPARVEPATHAQVEAVGLDGIELKFVHEQQVQPDEQESGMLRDLWKGMVDDILGPASARKAV